MYRPNYVSKRDPAASSTTNSVDKSLASERDSACAIAVSEAFEAVYPSLSWQPMSGVMHALEKEQV